MHLARGHCGPAQRSLFAGVGGAALGFVFMQGLCVLFLKGPLKDTAFEGCTRILLPSNQSLNYNGALTQLFLPKLLQGSTNITEEPRRWDVTLEATTKRSRNRPLY